uniref:Bm2269 n=1 Tax=Brugia malayi TaxID=6279 RepID=A0A0J9Y8R6_BRUMA|nr:Bm2269 [Brugia malayi]
MKIMEAEEMEYEMEQRSQSVISDNDVLRKDYQYYPMTKRYQYTKETVAPVTFPSVVTTKSDDSYWCYHCTSPLNIMGGNMQHAIEKFLRIRRTVYPIHVKSSRCSEPRNLTELAVEYCRHPYCQTLILTDHDTGWFLIISFIILKKIFFRLHEQLDIQECICRHRRYCYPGAKRRLFDASSSTILVALAPTNDVISIFYHLLLICLSIIFYYHF